MVMGKLIECLTEAAVSAGVDIELEQEVKAINLEEGRCSIELPTGSEQFAFVWSTVTTLCGDRYNPVSTNTSCSQISTYRSMVLVYLILDQSQFTQITTPIIYPVPKLE